MDPPGSHSGVLIPGYRLGRLLRSVSTDVINDSRLYQDNVILRRYEAYSLVSMAAALVATVAFTCLLEEREDTTVLGFISVLVLCTVFVGDLFSVLVLTHQYYLVARMCTSGPTGFDTAKLFYLNDNVCFFRHAAIFTFMWSIPLLVLGVGLCIVDRQSAFSWSFVKCAILAAIFGCSIVFLVSAWLKQRRLFDAIMQVHVAAQNSSLHPALVTAKSAVVQRARSW